MFQTAEVLKVKGLAEMPEQNNISLSKSRSLSSDKGDEASVVNAEGSSVWGGDSVRQSPSPLPMSPSVRRKRLRKTSTGSGSGSTGKRIPQFFWSLKNNFQVNIFIGMFGS